MAVLDRTEEWEGRTTAVLVFGFRYLHSGSGAEIDVPDQFITDFASIPPGARVAFEPFGRHAKAAVLHDWLYAVGEPGKKWFADQVFYDAMMELGVDAWRAKTMYMAVRAFGDGAYSQAESGWDKRWADWHSGDRLAGAPTKRERWFQEKWSSSPEAAYAQW
ncbi:protein of unassigned function [Methylobacterium oryzae CBMB20]|uniref:Protein of unassigned function n=1 Tax=Methylobacterium oryzae CBMB20 TaxID=693986 RepID=A0A089P509_9HYPH|nr:protein of unassigned function [Methylobacterium oryzae CBMB20]